MKRKIFKDYISCKNEKNNFVKLKKSTCQYDKISKVCD